MRGFGRVLAMTAFAVVLGLISTVAMADCGSGRVIYQDQFQALDPSWGFNADDPEVSIQNGTLIMKPDSGYERYLLSQTNFYGDVSVCVDVTVAKSKTEEQTWAGLRS